MIASAIFREFFRILLISHGAAHDSIVEAEEDCLENAPKAEGFGHEVDGIVDYGLPDEE